MPSFLRRSGCSSPKLPTIRPSAAATMTAAKPGWSHAVSVGSAVRISTCLAVAALLAPPVREAQSSSYPRPASSSSTRPRRSCRSSWSVVTGFRKCSRCPVSTPATRVRSLGRAPCVAEGKKTSPTSNRRMSVRPCVKLLCSASSSPGNSWVRSTESSSRSGLSSSSGATACAPPTIRSFSGPVIENSCTSSRPSAAQRSRAVSALRRSTTAGVCSGGGAMRSAGKVGVSLSMPNKRPTSSIRSISRVRSGRDVGTCATSTPPSPLAISMPRVVSSEACVVGGMCMPKIASVRCGLSVTCARATVCG